MKRNRQSRIVAILTLCVSVVGLTLGFAAFSNTLTISSSATVSPDESDFKLVLYGLPEGNYDNINFKDSNSLAPSLFTSTTTASPIVGTTNSSAVLPTAIPAVIDNDNLSLKNLTAEFKTPGAEVEYYFILKNEGQYDAHGNVFKVQFPSHTCEAGERTTESLVTEACKDMSFDFHVGTVDTDTSNIEWDITKKMDENGDITLKKGDYWYIHVCLDYLENYQFSTRADGPFTVKWDDLKIDFSTAKQ